MKKVRSISTHSPSFAADGFSTDWQTVATQSPCIPLQARGQTDSSAPQICEKHSKYTIGMLPVVVVHEQGSAGSVVKADIMQR